jgi:hypothetical protein
VRLSRRKRTCELAHMIVDAYTYRNAGTTYAITNNDTSEQMRHLCTSCDYHVRRLVAFFDVVVPHALVSRALHEPALVRCVHLLIGYFGLVIAWHFALTVVAENLNKRCCGSIVPVANSNCQGDLIALVISSQ